MSAKTCNPNADFFGNIIKHTALEFQLMIIHVKLLSNHSINVLSLV